MVLLSTANGLLVFGPIQMNVTFNNYTSIVDQLNSAVDEVVQSKCVRVCGRLRVKLMGGGMAVEGIQSSCCLSSCRPSERDNGVPKRR